MGKQREQTPGITTSKVKRYTHNKVHEITTKTSEHTPGVPLG